MAAASGSASEAKFHLSLICRKSPLLAQRAREKWGTHSADTQENL
jgi:hypothetical protein